ncbi:MAG: TlpA family protein disulfide reductase [Chloroflexi bacterium]|nr:TlpA family protein disulfide reductase [Chloroflexota bacterium]
MTDDPTTPVSGAITSPAPSARGTRLVAGVAGALIGLVLIALAVALWRGVGQPDQGLSDLGGTTAPSFTLEQFDGGAFALADYADRPVFIYFWASWCAPCAEEAPVIEELWPEYRDRGYVFLGVNIWDLRSDAERFIEEFGLTFPVARDADRAVYVEYGVQGLPVAFFVEPGLQIRSRYDGPLDEATLRNELERIAWAAS